jgi:hypothetical protein
MNSQPTSFLKSVSVTRPSDTTAYTAGDAMGDTSGSAIMSFDLGCPTGAQVLITDINLRWNVTALPSGASTFRLHLYNASPDAIADNAAWDLSSAGDRGKYLGYVDLITPQDLGSTLYSPNSNVNKLVKLAADSQIVYGVLQTVGAYTPASAAVHVVEVGALLA